MPAGAGAESTRDIRAAAAATTAAEICSTEVQGATWKAAGVALLVSLAVASVLAILVVWWIQPLAEIQARRAKLDALAAGVADLETRGGKAKLQIWKGPRCPGTSLTASSRNSSVQF